MQIESSSGASRREFLKTAAVAGSAVAANLALMANAHAGDSSEIIKVGLIGCGGRGTGAAEQNMKADKNIRLWAMGDVFEDRLEGSLKHLSKNEEQCKVAKERQFTGLDAYKKVLDSGVDLVILATPPGFRPFHLEAAVAAGKHIFTEKPVAVDGAGIRKVLAAYEEAKKKNLAVAAGTQRRHQTGYIETIKQLHDGAIGDIVSARCYWNQGGLWHRDRDPKWSDVEFQIRNWLYYVWLSGDHICEQHVHNLDVINWVQGAHPTVAHGMGGRQVRTDPKFGHIFDHFSVEFEYPNGSTLQSFCRQIDGTEQSVSEFVQGTKGKCQVNGYTIHGEKPWRFSGNDNLPYEQEHVDLVQSIRAGKPINELKNVAESTLTAILGRIATYTGRRTTWEEALASESTMPDGLTMQTSVPVPPVAMPGKKS